MTTSSTLPRPRQVTLAAWMIMAGSLLVIGTVADRVAGLNTLETREAIEAFLSRPPGDGLGLDVPGVVATLHVVSMVAGGCAAAAAILGYHVLRRNRGARIGLTVLAVPLFLSGLVAGGFLSSVVAASALMLWLQPSRDWFAGRPAKKPERAPEPVRREPPPPPAGPRPHQGFGTAPGPGAPPPYAPPMAFGTTGPPLVSHPIPTRPARPSAVVTACVLTWVFTGLAALLMAGSALIMLASPDLVFEEMQRQNPDFAGQGVSDRSIQVATIVVAAVTVVWSLAAAGFAFALLRRRAWGRVALLVSAIVAAVVCVVGVGLGAVVMVVPLGACVATISLLLRRDLRSWVAAP